MKRHCIRKYYPIAHSFSVQLDGDGANFGLDDPFGHEDANSQATLEDLCRSHLVSTTLTLHIAYGDCS